MKKRSKINILADKISKFLWRYFELFAIVFVSVSPLKSIPAEIVFLIVLIIANRRYLCCSRRLILLLAICFIVPTAIDMALHHAVGFSPHSVVFPLYFTLGYVMSRKYRFEELWLRLEEIFIALAALSLFGFALQCFFPEIISGTIMYEMNGVSHRSILINNFLYVGDYQVLRNCGIAWEPGVFQILLNLGLAYSIFNYRGKKLFARVAIYGITIFTTKSTAGYVISLLLVITLIIKYRKYFWLIALGAICLWPFISSEIAYQFAYKTPGSDSFSARFVPAVNVFRNNFAKPFGEGNIGYELSYKKDKLGSFDSYSQIFVRYGYPLLICCLAQALALCRANWALGAVVVLSFLSEPVWGTILFSMILWSADTRLD